MATSYTANASDGHRRQRARSNRIRLSGGYTAEERRGLQTLNRAQVKNARADARRNRARQLRINISNSSLSTFERKGQRAINRAAVKNANPRQSKNLRAIRSRNAKNQARDSKGRFK